MAYEMRWARGTAVESDDGLIQVKEVSGYYNPFSHYFPGSDKKSLYLTFASLDPNSKEDILRFCSEFGVLGTSVYVEDISRELDHEALRRALYMGQAMAFANGVEAGLDSSRGVPLTPEQEAELDAGRQAEGMAAAEWFRKYRPTDPIQPRTPSYWAEKLLQRRDGAQDWDTMDLFKMELTNMRRVLNLWRACTEQISTNLEIASTIAELDIRLYDERDIDELGATEELAIEALTRRFSQLDSLELRSEGLATVEQAVEVQLAGRVHFRVQHEGDKFAQSWSTTNLLSAMYLMLAWDLSRSQPARPCVNPKCQAFFIPSRPSQVYCSQTCQNQDRVRRWRQNQKKEGKTDAGSPSSEG